MLRQVYVNVNVSQVGRSPLSAEDRVKVCISHSATVRTVTASAAAGSYIGLARTDTGQKGDRMDAIFVIDLISVLAASVCGGFLVYGGWLCLAEREEKSPQGEDLAGHVARKALLP